MKALLNIVLTVVFISCAAVAQAKPLNEQGVERVRAVKKMLGVAEPKTVEQIVRDLEKLQYTELNLKMREAMAKVYVDIVAEQEVKDPKKKVWLYSMITLNMAYLQFDANQESAGRTQPLNKLIRQKLRKALTPEVMKEPGFHVSI